MQQLCEGQVTGYIGSGLKRKKLLRTALCPALKCDVAFTESV